MEVLLIYQKNRDNFSQMEVASRHLHGSNFPPSSSPPFSLHPHLPHSSIGIKGQNPNLLRQVSPFPPDLSYSHYDCSGNRRKRWLFSPSIRLVSIVSSGFSCVLFVGYRLVSCYLIWVLLIPWLLVSFGLFRSVYLKSDVGFFLGRGRWKLGFLSTVKRCCWDNTGRDSNVRTKWWELIS